MFAALLFLKYRRALNVSFVAIVALWTAWCLYWPFFARNQDFRAAATEAEATYRVCLEQRTVTPADCRVDREAYENRLKQTSVPLDENAYQWFAGRNLVDEIRFMAMLCLVPPAILFAFARLGVEIFLHFSIQHSGR